MIEHKFWRAKKDVEQMVAKIIKEDYPDTLHKVKPRVDLLMVEPPKDEAGNPKGPALSSHGHPVAANIQIMPLERRALGAGDVLIRIDAEYWHRDTTNDANRKALMDHELHHLKVVYVEGEQGAFKTDDLDRPLFKIREHDYEFGWFVAIAARHGVASLEVQQAMMIQEKSPQLLFNFAGEAKPEQEQLHIVEEPKAAEAAGAE